MRNSLQRFWKSITNNWTMKLLALALAALTFFIIQGKTGIEIPYDIPLQAKFEEKGIAILQQEPRTVRVTFRGSQEDLARIEQRRLQAIVRPKGGSISGVEQVPIGPGIVEGVPSGVRVVKVEPNVASLHFDRETEKQVEVEPPKVIGTPLVGNAQIEYEPQVVTIRGPMRRIESQTSLSTEPVDVTDRVASFSTEVAVLPPSGSWVPEIEPSEITVHVTIVTESKVNEWTNVAVLVVGPPGQADSLQIDPSRVNVTVKGRSEELENLTQDSITVFVDVTGVEPRGSYVLPVLVHLPPGMDVTAGVSPESVNVIFEAP